MQFKTGVFTYFFFHFKNFLSCEFQSWFSKEKGIVYMLLIPVQSPSGILHFLCLGGLLSYGSYSNSSRASHQRIGERSKKYFVLSRIGSNSANQRLESSKLLNCLGRKYPLVSLWTHSCFWNFHFKCLSILHCPARTMCMQLPGIITGDMYILGWRASILCHYGNGTSMSKERGRWCFGQGVYPQRDFQRHRGI